MCQACGGACGALPSRRSGLVLDVNVAGRSLRIRDAGGAAPLYVSRPLDADSASRMTEWARRCGFVDLVPQDQMHVTVAYSRAPVDWFKFPSWFAADDLVVPAGGPRRVETFDGDVSVLRFASEPLNLRWDEFRRGGCSWDHPSYAPHITFAGRLGTADPSRLKAFAGELRFGPEEFAPI
ncbi:phage-associated protein, HI1409 family [Methylorubrum populi]|uniref:Anti-CBASS protein Acb1 n=1 Tax=Methylorubrum populi TaxID=223967 RepID=A0A169RGC4_9HYPH|nr:phage-associated protein, HI1409 family [Methylorubrum populi]